MIDTIKLQAGDSVFWLDDMDDVIEHTYLGTINDVVILSGELMNGKEIKGFPVPKIPLVDHDIFTKIRELAEQNETYRYYPVCFAKQEHLFITKEEAENSIVNKVWQGDSMKRNWYIIGMK